MQRLQHIGIVCLILVGALSAGCDKSAPIENRPKAYTAVAYLDVRPLAEGNPASEVINSMAISERIALEVKLAWEYDLAAEMARQAEGGLMSSDWYQANQGAEVAQALAAVMRIAPARGNPGRIAVNVTLPDPEDAALLATQAAQAIEACSDASIMQVHEVQIQELSTSHNILAEKIARKTSQIEELRALLDITGDDGTGDLLAVLQAREAALMTSIAEAQELIRKLNVHSGDQLVALPAVRAILREQGDYEAKEEKLKALRIEYNSLLHEHGRGHAAVETAADEIAVLNAELLRVQFAVVEGLRADTTQAIVEGQAQLEAIRDQQVACEKVMGGASDVHERLAGLDRELGYLRYRRQATEEEIDTLRALMANDGRLVFVVPAAVPTEPD